MRPPPPAIITAHHNVAPLRDSTAPFNPTLLRPRGTEERPFILAFLVVLPDAE